MWTRSANLVAAKVFRPRWRPSLVAGTRIGTAARSADYTVLAIETSCDDTSVAVVETLPKGSTDWTSRAVSGVGGVVVKFHEKITASNQGYTGIHPLVALESHRANLAPLLQKAIKRMQEDQDEDGKKEDFFPTIVAVTRGPGMRSNLSVGLDTAKGLVLAWNSELIGVHHMQAHALTPRLLSMIDKEQTEAKPEFPFLTLLVSGGHTMLIDSKSLTDHTMLAETQDIALGQFLDRAARVIMPPELLREPYGRALEQFAFETCISSRDRSGSSDIEDERMAFGNEYIEPCPAQYEYVAPTTRQELLEPHSNHWGWSLKPPLVERKGGESKRMEYSFSGLLTYVERLVKHATESTEMSLKERQDLAREVQRVSFEHLASRLLLFSETPSAAFKGDTIVVSGGVASNDYLRHFLRKLLDARGFNHVKLIFPPTELCTDNALMIAWAGIEMYEAGYTSTFDIGPIRKWSVDPEAPDGGILGVDGWVDEYKRA